MKRLLILILTLSVFMNTSITVNAAAKKKVPTIKAKLEWETSKKISTGKTYIKVKELESSINHNYFVKFKVPKDGDYKFTGSNGTWRDASSDQNWFFGFKTLSDSGDSLDFIRDSSSKVMETDVLYTKAYTSKYPNSKVIKSSQSLTLKNLKKGEVIYIYFFVQYDNFKCTFNVKRV